MHGDALEAHLLELPYGGAHKLVVHNDKRERGGEEGGRGV